MTFYFCELAAMALLAYGWWTFASSVNDVFALCAVGGLRRYRLTQYIQIARKMTLAFPTWFLWVAWLVISPRELLNSAGVCEMWWWWYVCIKYIFNFKTSNRAYGQACVCFVSSDIVRTNY